MSGELHRNDGIFVDAIFSLAITAHETRFGKILLNTVF